MPPQIQQRHLLHLAADAFGAHQAIGETMFTGGVAASFSASYIHGLNDNAFAGNSESRITNYGTTLAVFGGYKR
jgi:hypothetical protein